MILTPETGLVASRFVFFTALMLLSGIVITTQYLAPAGLADCLRQKLSRLASYCIGSECLAACLVFITEAGLMGEGWGDAINPAVWLAMLTTHFGQVWILILFCSFFLLGCSRAVGNVRSSVWFVVVLIQWILCSCIGHGAIHSGGIGFLQRAVYTLHMFSGAWWGGSLIPLLVCLRLGSQAQWRDSARITMMRFSYYGHLAVAAVIMTGFVNTVLITEQWLPPESLYRTLLLIKMGLVGIMVMLALVNRYWLVPSFRRNTRSRARFIQFTWLEVLLSTGTLLLVSLLAILEPF